MSVLRIGTVLAAILVAYFLVTEYHALPSSVVTAEQQLLAEMVQVRDGLGLDSSPIAAQEQLRTIQPQVVLKGRMRIEIVQGGVLLGAIDGARLRLTPVTKSGELKWECTGSPQDRVPTGCKSSTLGR